MSNVEANKILVLGATGMLGHAVLRYFASRGCHRLAGSVRYEASVRLLPESLQQYIVPGVDVENIDSLIHLVETVRPEIVINCIGLIKQLAHAHEPLSAIPINSLLPHRLARLCALSGARLLHISTDCVFSGSAGMYHEDQPADAADLYGRSKALGEVASSPAVTLRTSVIGHELRGAHGLLEWFLAEEGEVRGFTRAIFSGLPTVELARVMHDFIIPSRNLFGLYHVSADPIDKYSLLQLIARAYGKEIAINPDDGLVIDRSLDSSRFRMITGYAPPPWPELIARMREFG